MMNKEQRQQIVLDAIKECANVSDPVQYAQMNYRVYEVAMKAVEIANSNDAMQTLIKKQMRDRYEFVKKQYSPIYAEVEVTFKDKEDAIHTLEIARWKMLPPSPADGNTIRFSITDDFTASPQAIERWEEFFGNAKK